MLPVLIVCYLRPEKLEALLKKLQSSQRRIFVFIDRAPPPFVDLNQSVVKVAEKYSMEFEIEICWADKNYGVGLGVPTALDWVFKFVNEVIVLEDDCLPTLNALKYFDNQADRLENDLKLACGTSPWPPENQDSVNAKLTTSSYPLIWGWSTNKENWIEISELIRNDLSHLRVLRSVLKNPLRIREIGFFYAATIRVKKGRLKAWDSPLALEMLLENYWSIIPNFSLVENSGQDRFASHFSNPDLLFGEIVSKSFLGEPSIEIDLSKGVRKTTNKEIENTIYKMKYRHALSPVKAFLGF